MSRMSSAVVGGNGGASGSGLSRGASECRPAGQKAPDRVGGGGMGRSNTAPTNRGKHQQPGLQRASTGFSVYADTQSVGQGGSAQGAGRGDTSSTQSNRMPLKQVSRQESKVNNVVRNKEERQNMKVSTCTQCDEFYAGMARVNNDMTHSVRPDGPCEHQNVANAGRHRHNFTPPKTPDGYWQIGWDSTQDATQDDA